MKQKSDRYLVAIDLLKKQKSAEAKAILVELCEKDDSNPFADMNLASILAREDDFITAAKYYLRARLVMQKANKESLKEDIEFINKQLYHLAGDLSKKGEKFLSNGDFDKAETCFRATKEIGSIYANYNLAILNTKKKRYDQAREHLKESLDVGLSLLASNDDEAKNDALKLLAATHNTLGTLDIQGYGCPNKDPNPLKAMQNFKSALAFKPDHALAKANKNKLKSMMAPESIKFFKDETKTLKQTNGRVTFCNFIIEFANTSNIQSYIRENPEFNSSSAINDLLSNYLAGTSKKISFKEDDKDLSDSFGTKMEI